jgi:hypothetical protein
MAHVKVTALPEPKTIIVRPGPYYWQWRYSNESDTKYRSTGVLARISPQTAMDAIGRQWRKFHRGVTLTVLQETSINQPV